MTHTIESYVNRDPIGVDREQHATAARAVAKAGGLDTCDGKELTLIYRLQEEISSTVTNAHNSPLTRHETYTLFECQDSIAWHLQNHVALAMWKRLQVKQDNPDVSAHMCACLIEWSLNRGVDILDDIVAVLSAISESEKIGEAA